MKETQKTILAWHKETFPLSDLMTQQERFEQEIDEFHNETDQEKRLLEMADAFISNCGVGRFSRERAVENWVYTIKPTLEKEKINHDDVHKKVIEKMTINRKRKWTYDETTGQYIRVDNKE